MLKRSLQDEGGEEKRPRREEHGELCTPTFKLLAPKTLASAIQFSHLVIENAAQGKLHLTEPDDLYPGTEQQVVTIESSAWEHIASALKNILAMANNCTECIMPGHEDERRLAVVMPSRSISALIGVKGANVKELQLRTSCHIHVDDVAIGALDGDGYGASAGPSVSSVPAAPAALAAAAGPAPAPQHPPPFFPLKEFLQQSGVSDLPRLRVIDVGAMFLNEAEEIWQPLQRRGHCESVVGFEPCAEECDRLNHSVNSLKTSEDP
eukprot:symbB.v1.2.033067.t1/scaffold4057.1/size45452/1